MIILKILKSYLSIFLIGLLIHLVLFFIFVNLDSTKFDSTCGEISCWILIVMDLPLSLTFLSGDSMTITKYSLTLGTLWWGTLMVILSLVFRLIKNKLSK